MNKTVFKFIWVSTVSLVIIIALICYSVPKVYAGNSLVLSSQYKSNVLVYIENNKVTLVGSNIDIGDLSYIMKDLKIRNIDKIIAYDLKLNSVDNLLKISDEYGVNEIYIPNDYAYEEITDKITNAKTFNNLYDAQDLKLKVVCYNDDMIGVHLTFGDINLLIPAMDDNKKERQHLVDQYVFDSVLVSNIGDWLDMLDESKLIDMTTVDYVMVNG